MGFHASEPLAVSSTAIHELARLLGLPLRLGIFNAPLQRPPPSLTHALFPAATLAPPGFPEGTRAMVLPPSLDIDAFPPLSPSDLAAKRYIAMRTLAKIPRQNMHLPQWTRHGHAPSRLLHPYSIVTHALVEAVAATAADHKEVRGASWQLFPAAKIPPVVETHPLVSLLRRAWDGSFVSWSGGRRANPYRPFASMRGLKGRQHLDVPRGCTSGNASLPAAIADRHSGIAFLTAVPEGCESPQTWPYSHLAATEADGSTEGIRAPWETPVPHWENVTSVVVAPSAAPLPAGTHTAAALLRALEASGAPAAEVAALRSDLLRGTLGGRKTLVYLRYRDVPTPGISSDSVEGNVAEAWHAMTGSGGPSWGWGWGAAATGTGSAMAWLHSAGHQLHRQWQQLYATDATALAPYRRLSDALRALSRPSRSPLEPREAATDHTMEMFEIVKELKELLQVHGEGWATLEKAVASGKWCCRCDPWLGFPQSSGVPFLLTPFFILHCLNVSSCVDDSNMALAAASSPLPQFRFEWDRGCSALRNQSADPSGL